MKQETKKYSSSVPSEGGSEELGTSEALGLTGSAIREGKHKPVKVCCAHM